MDYIVGKSDEAKDLIHLGIHDSENGITEWCVVISDKDFGKSLSGPLSELLFELKRFEGEGYESRAPLTAFNTSILIETISAAYAQRGSV